MFRTHSHVPGSETSREWIPEGRWYDRRVVLAAFLAGLAVSFVALGFAVVRGVGLWKQAKRTGMALTAQAEAFEAKSARTEQLLAENERASAELQAALERLRTSRARLRVLTQSIERSTTSVRWLRAFLPG